MEWDQKQKIIAALCECPSLISEDSRNAIFLELPESIRNSVKHGDTLQTNITNLLNACLNHPGGVQIFREILRFYENGSEPLQRIEALWPGGNESEDSARCSATTDGIDPPALDAQHPAENRVQKAKRREQREWSLYISAGLLASLPLILTQAQALGCAFQVMSDTRLKLISFLFLGIAAGVNAIPGPASIKKVKLFAGGLAFGLLLFLGYTSLRPVNPQDCQPFIPITATGTPTPTSLPSATVTPLPPTITDTPFPTNTFTPTPSPTHTITATPSRTSSPTGTPTITLTFTPTATYTPTPYPTRIADSDQAQMVLVPAGPFMMGANAGTDLNAVPEQTIYLNSYWIDLTEVTNGMYALCVKAGGCSPPVHSYSSTVSQYYGNPVYADYPVIFVNWNQAKTYCAWAGRRLPNEAEWEKAARGTDGRIYPWGGSETEAPDCAQANVKGCRQDVTQVGRYPQAASPYGVLDLTGNVAEWTSSRFISYPYDPSDGRENPNLRGKDILRVIRGGSWLSSPLALRTYYRSEIRQDPDKPFKPDYTSSLVGFRCAADGD